MAVARNNVKKIVEYAIDQAIGELEGLVDTGKADNDDILDNLEFWPDFREAWEHYIKDNEKWE